VQDFLSVNDTTVWNDARTYVPTQIATIENLRRDLELSRLLEAQAVARVQLRDRAVEIYEENDGALSVEECLRMAAEEEDAPGIATVA
jgi:hypothetical protein